VAAFAECPQTGHLAKTIFAERYSVTLGKTYLFFFLFSTQTFSVVILDYLELHMQVWHITQIVCYI
jgi:hypothetical protein